MKDYGNYGRLCPLCDASREPNTYTCNACWQRVEGWNIFFESGRAKCAQCRRAHDEGTRSRCPLHAINILDPEAEREKLIKALRDAGLVDERGIMMCEPAGTK